MDSNKELCQFGSNGDYSVEDLPQRCISCIETALHSSATNVESYTHEVDDAHAGFQEFTDYSGAVSGQNRRIRIVNGVINPTDNSKIPQSREYVRFDCPNT